MQFLLIQQPILSHHLHFGQCLQLEQLSQPFDASIVGTSDAFIISSPTLKPFDSIIPISAGVKRWQKPEKARRQNGRKRSILEGQVQIHTLAKGLWVFIQVQAGCQNTTASGHVHIYCQIFCTLLDFISIWQHFYWGRPVQMLFDSSFIGDPPNCLARVLFQFHKSFTRITLVS